VIDRIAPTGDEGRVALPLPKMADRSLDFSFSGLKTAVLRFAQAEGLVAGWAKHTGGEEAGAEASGEGAPAAPRQGDAPAHRPAQGARGSPFGTATLAQSSPVQPSGGEPDAGGPPQIVRDLCASFQKTAVRLLVERTTRAAEEEGVRSVIVSGGVACNSRLRAEMAAACAQRGLALHIPPPRLCTDNAAMIASAAFLHLERGDVAGLSLNADPGLRLGVPRPPGRR